MTLIEDLKHAFEQAGRYDDPRDLGVDCVLAEDEIIDTSRHQIYHTAVFHRKSVRHNYDAPPDFIDEYVGVDYSEPVDDDGWEQFGVPDIYEVVPEVVNVTVTKYRKVTE